MIFADSYFCIGKQHANEGKPCQDYAVTQVTEDSAIAVISDGCSTGGKTDIGARIVSFAAIRSVNVSGIISKSHIKSLLHPDVYFPFVLGKESLYATLGVLIFDEAGLTSQLYGDGVVAYKNEDGDIYATRYEWIKGAPYYLAYNDENFIDQVCDGNPDLVSCVKDDWTYVAANKAWEMPFIEKVSAKQGMEGFSDKYFCREKSGFLAIFSDGITQIKDVDWKDAVFEFMNYKSTSGEFVKRRMMKALKTMTPMDDIACAALRITPDANNEANTINA